MNIFKGSFFFLLLIVNGLCLAQTVELKIEVTADQNPQEISWSLFDDANNVILTDGGEIVAPFERYEKSISVNSADCYRFEIYDEGGDGVLGPGRYKIFYNGQTILNALDNFYFFAEHYINCHDIGATCENAYPVYDKKITTPIRENSWYVINVPFDLFMNISTCQNSENMEVVLDTDIWIYDSCPTTLYDGPEGALIFNDSYFICEPGASLLNFKFEANTDYYVRVKTHDLNWPDDLIVLFSKTPDLYGCKDPQACNYNPFANKEDGSCIIEECLPDLAILQPNLYYTMELDTITNVDECYIEEGCLTGMGLRDIVRFETAIENVGTTDYIIGKPTDNPDAFSNDNCHEHWHQLGYAEYLLYAGAGDPEPIGFKNGFCVLDLFCPNISAAKYNCGYMGLTAGCRDVYDVTIDCQWIDVTDIADGDYTMVARINWTEQVDLRGKREANYENNWAQVCFNLDRSSGKLVLTLLDECATYTDCNGVLYGSATLDCKGECGGLAHFGDINNDLLLNDLDVTTYMESIISDQAINSPCLDLDGNGQLNIYDVALMRECTETTEGEMAVVHRHCLFPSGYTNYNETIYVQLDELDANNQSIDFQYLSSNSDLFAFDVEFSGITIASIESLIENELEIYWSENRVLVLAKPNTQISKNTILSDLFRINIAEISQPEICISEVNDIVNGNYEKTVPGFGESCRFGEVTSLDEIAANLNVKLFPNPADDFLWIQNLKNQQIEKVELFNSTGKLIIQQKNNLANAMKIQTNHLPNGIYFIKIITNDSSISVEKVIVQH